MKKKLLTLLFVPLMSLTGCGKKTSFAYDMFFQIDETSQMEEIIKYFNEKLSRLDFSDKNSSVVQYNSDTIKVSLNAPDKNVLSIITTVLISNSPLAMSNAHNTYVHPIVIEDKPAYFSSENEYPTVNIPVNLNDEKFSQMINELNSDIDNDNTDYPYEDFGSGEDGEELTYSYSLYLWHRFDISECTFEGLKNFEIDTTRHLIAMISFSKENMPQDNLQLTVNVDANGDGYANENEIWSASITAKGIVELINEKENNYQINPVGKPEQ